MPSQPSSLPSKSKNNTTITTTTIIRQPPSTATPRLRDQLIRVQLELMSDMAVDVALSPRIDGSNNSLTSNNGTVDFSTADAAAASPSKISQRNDEIGIVGATNNVGRSPTDDNYANNNYDGSGGSNNNNSSGTSPSSPLFGSIPNCIPNAARAIASMLSGTVARVTHEQQQQQHADNHDDIESSATAAKVVSEVMYANNLLSSGNVDDYYCDQNITAAVSDVTNAAAAAAAAASSSSSNSNHINDATGEESSSNNDYPQKNDSSSTTVSHVVVSLDDDHYKEIMWKHFRILGKSRDIELSKVGNEILVEFKQQMSSNGGRFYRRERGQEIEIDDDKALCKINADIGRRMRNYQAWSNSPTKQASKHKSINASSPKSSLAKRGSPPIANPSRTTETQPRRSTRERALEEATMPPSYPQKREAKTSSSTTSEISNRRSSSRTPTQSETVRNNLVPKECDITLSLSDDKYKEVMYKHFSMLGKRQSGETKSDEIASKQICRLFKKRLGRSGGRFFSRIAQSDMFIVVDNEVALQKITADISKRNKSIHRWLRRNSNDQHQSSFKSSDEIIPDHRSLLITQNYAWRDKLVASPIAFDERPSSSKPNHHLTCIPKKSSSKPSLVDKFLYTTKKKSTSERLESSHLGQRLPPLGSLTFIKWVQRPNQLIQMLQLATHKLNELHGTSHTHNKMLRLFNLSEFSVHPNDVISNAPTVSELAEYMDITPITLKKWFTFYKNAIMRDFDFNQFGDERIKDHHSIFYAEDELYRLSQLGEMTIEEYFRQVGEEVFEDAVDACKDSRSRDCMNNRSESLEFNDLTHIYNIFDDDSAETSSGPSIRESRRSKIARCEPMIIIAEDDEDQLLDSISPFDRHLQINRAYLAELLSRDDDDAKNIQLGSSCKRMKAGSKDRVICMVSGCEKHAQAKSNGCCSSHFRILSKGKSKTNAVFAPRKSLPKLDLESRKDDRPVTLGKRKSGDMQNLSILSNIEIGSRIYVECNDNLWKATVKKVLPDVVSPKLKIHYDGKKKHLIDTVSFDMVKSFIEGENEAFDHHKRAKSEPQPRFNGSQEIQSHHCQHVSNIFPLLPRLYPAVLPPGESEVLQNCPELGTGWKINLITRKMKSGGTRIDRYFISPAGRKLQGVPEVERYYATNSTEFGVLPIDTNIISSAPQHVEDEWLTYMARQGTSPPEHQPSFYEQSGARISDMRSLISISPIITTGSLISSNDFPIHAARKSPGEVTTSTVFTSPARKVQAPLVHQLQSLLFSSPFPGMRRGSTDLGAVNSRSRENDESNGQRPQRKRKSIERFEEQDIPRAGPAVGLIGQSKIALCHCPDCNKMNMSIQSIYSHYGKVHSGKLPWGRVTYSCPFCVDNDAHHVFKTFPDVEAHVNTTHQGCEVIGSHSSKRHSISARTHTSISNNDMPTKTNRVTRERKAPPNIRMTSVPVIAPQGITMKSLPISWSKIDYVHLLPDGKKQYPRGLCNVIEMIDEQCRSQEEILEVAREQRIKLCRDEVELEIKAFSEERLVFQRGLRERNRLADCERIEKQQFIDDLEQKMIFYEYKNRNKGRKKEEIELRKLYTRPIVFSNEVQRQSTRQDKFCNDDQCLFCNKGKGFHHCLLLENEIEKFNMDASPNDTPIIAQSTYVLKPSVTVINDSFFAENDETIPINGDGKNSKRSSKSRQDATTAKRVRAEEDKLLSLRNIKYSLEFIKKYNNGMIVNAWGEAKKDAIEMDDPSSADELTETDGAPMGQPNLAIAINSRRYRTLPSLEQQCRTISSSFMTNSDESFLVTQPPDYTQKLDRRMTLSQEDVLSSSSSLHNDDDHYEEGHDHTTRDWAMDEAVDDDGIISQPATQPPLTQQINTTNNGSGTAILSVSDEHLLTKADQSQHSIGGTTDDKLWRTKDNDYDESDDSLKEASRSTFTLGFVTGRSRTAITVSDEQIAKAQMILDTTNNHPLHDDDDDDNNNEQDNNHKNIMYASNGSNTSVIETAHNKSSSMVGFCTGGSRKAIEITKEQLHKAGKILEATTTMMQHPQQQDSSTLNNTEYDNISNDDGLIIHNNRLNDHNTKSSTKSSIMLGFCTGGSGKSISVSDEQIASAIKLLDTDQQDTVSQWGAGDDDNDDEEEGDIKTQPVTQLMTQPCDLARVRRHGAEIENERYHQQIAIILPPAQAMTGSGDDVTDMMEIDQTTNSSLQRADVGRGYDTNTLVNTADIIATPNHGTNIVTNAVTNPYARNSCMESLLKRPFDQISGEIRNQVYNPYHKSNQTSSKRMMGNPYSKSRTSRSDIVNLPASTTINNSHQERPPPTVAPVSSVRRTGVSISLPMVERLPSRNVSYRPAEILTVSELYHYLCECWEDAEDDKGPSKRTASSKELISVRITGMLLCVANSITDEKDGVRANLYNSGMYLLVGDPLDNTRLVRKDNTANMDLEQNTVGSKMNNVTNIKVSKTGLTSILRIKSASTLQSSTDTTRVPGVTPATAIKYHEPTKKGPAAKPENESDNTDISNRKPASRGILNTTKKKKLVYNGGGSRLSFGGLGAGKGIGGLGGRKFTTPKRASSSVVPVNNLMKKTSSSLHAKRGLFTSIHSTNNKNLNPIQIIQRHPSSLVPVWIGSSYDDDGLDGSVVGDLVMIMGEIVTELCINCHQRDTSAPNDGSENSDLQQEETNAEGDSNKTSRIPLIPVAQLRGVTDAANLLASTAMKISGKSLKCGCRRFLQARLIKNANGTDMSLQRESLRVRRAYMAERKRLMEALTTVENADKMYSVGYGTPY